MYSFILINFNFKLDDFAKKYKLMKLIQEEVANSHKPITEVTAKVTRNIFIR